jgi:hypothetical protein
LIAKCRFKIRGDVAFNFFERIPGEFAAVENRGVPSLVQVKQIGWFEHDGKLGETRPRQKRDFIENFVGAGEGNRTFATGIVVYSGAIY